MEFDNYTLRLINIDDVAAFYQLVQDNLDSLEDTFAGTVVKNQTIDMTRDFIHTSLKKITDKTYFPFVISELSSGNLVGLIDLKNINWDVPKTEIGYFIDIKYRGRGITSKALNKVIAYSFNELKMKKLFLRTTEKNIGSQKVAEKNGFEKEGFIKQDYRTVSGEVVDLIYYGLIQT